MDKLTEVRFLLGRAGEVARGDLVVVLDRLWRDVAACVQVDSTTVEGRRRLCAELREVHNAVRTLYRGLMLARKTDRVVRLAMRLDAVRTRLMELLREWGNAPGGE